MDEKIIVEYRNAIFTDLLDKNDITIIECEINHPTYGWIPFGLSPNDRNSDIDTAELYDRIILDQM